MPPRRKRKTTSPPCFACASAPKRRGRPKKTAAPKPEPEPEPQEVTESAKIREEGNQLFALAKDTTIAPVLRKARFHEALSKYSTALNLAQRHGDIASAAKNIAMANWRLANLLISREEAFSYARSCFKESVTHFSRSHICALTTKCKNAEWQTGLTKSFYECIQEALDTLEDLAFDKKMASYEEYVFLVDHEDIRAEYSIKIANQYFHESIRKLVDTDFKACLKYLHECYRPIEEAARAGRSLKDTMTEVKILREDVRLNTCTAESRQAISTGDELYEEYELEDGDDPSAGAMIWEVLDWYKQAVVLTRECDVEVEAIAISRIGRVYGKVLNMKVRARENFNKAIQLAMSLQPRTFTTDAWFKECTETLEEYQKEQVEQEDLKWNRERQKYIDELKDVLKELKEKASQNDVEFLQFLYEKHPPIDARHKLPEDLPDVEDGCQRYNPELKNVLRKAVIHYHPDRCNVKQHGEKRKVLNEEVTKLLTKKYECLK